MVRFRERRETTAIFVVDASGSSAMARLPEVKGAIELLLADCYVRRDSVALVAFRGKTAEIVLPPTRSLMRAKRMLAGLPGGGGTPLACGLDAALALAESVRRKGPCPLLVLMTDGRANICREGAACREQAMEDALHSSSNCAPRGFHRSPSTPRRRHDAGGFSGVAAGSSDECTLCQVAFRRRGASLERRARRRAGVVTRHVRARRGFVFLWTSGSIGPTAKPVALSKRGACVGIFSSWETGPRCCCIHGGPAPRRIPGARWRRCWRGASPCSLPIFPGMASPDRKTPRPIASGNGPGA